MVYATNLFFICLYKYLYRYIILILCYNMVYYLKGYYRRDHYTFWYVGNGDKYYFVSKK